MRRPLSKRRVMPGEWGWQYNVFRVSPVTEDGLAQLCNDLDDMGIESWELVSVSDGFAYFKRPVMPGD